MNYDHHRGWSRLTTKGITITSYVCFVLQLYFGAQYSITLHFKVDRILSCYPTEHTTLQMCLWLSPTQLTTACNGWLLHSESTRNSLHSNRESYSLYTWTIQQHEFSKELYTRWTPVNDIATPWYSLTKRCYSRVSSPDKDYECVYTKLCYISIPQYLE